MDQSHLIELEQKIGYVFHEKTFLLRALTHRSYLNENSSWKLEHNERLEFLGDAVLELIVTEYLFKHYQNPEGEMTNWRAALVNANMLAKISSDINLNDYILLSHGEAKDTGRARQYILANAMESLIGSIYLDGGYKAAKEFIEHFILCKLPEIIKKRLYRDSKSLLQEEAQERMGITPVYSVIEEWGPDHARQFRVGVLLGREMAGQGEGPSKQEAQQNAAENALKKRGWG